MTTDKETTRVIVNAKALVKDTLGFTPKDPELDEGINEKNVSQRTSYLDLRKAHALAKKEGEKQKSTNSS